MAPRVKRQKLTEDGAEAVVSATSEAALSHAKATTTDPEKQSTVYIRFLPTDATNASLAEHFSESFPVKHAVVVTDKETGKNKGFGFVTFVDHEDARLAVEKYHGTDLGGRKLHVTFAEKRHREEGKEAPASTKVPQKDPPQSSKLIVRNLPWTMDNQEKLTKLFLSYGKINQAIVPKNPQGRMKGFGIVMLRGRKNAEKALQELNGKEIDGRTLAVDWAVDREAWQQAQEKEREIEAEAKAAANAEAKEAERIDSGNDDEEEDEDGHLDNDEELSELDSDEAMDDEDDEALSDASDEENEEQGNKLMTSNESVLFIRNLPFTTTDEDLYDHFGALYPVRYARIVIDRATERPRGTGFVCFYKKEDADTCLREAPRAARPVEDSKKGKKPDAKMAGPSILENEFTDPTGRFTMDGRVLQLSRAVDKNEADRLTTEGVDRRSQRDKDKRRLFLLGEGTIPSNSPLYAKLSSSEVAMRDASAKQRRKLVDSNPSLNVSLTRLSIRNIPRSVTTTDLKNLARQAVVGFATDVKEGNRARISKEELSRDTSETQDADKDRRSKKKGLVKQAKIIFEGSEGNKVEEGSGRSRGYGFVEYYTHRSALMGLRWLNGHAIEQSGQQTERKGKGSKAAAAEDAKDRKRRLIVEFAIENAQVVKRRQDREVKARERPTRSGKDGEDGEAIVTELERSSDRKGKGGERKGNRWGKNDKKKKGDGKDGAMYAAKRVARKAEKEGAAADEKERTKSETRMVIARKRRDRKEARRAGKGKK